MSDKHKQEAAEHAKRAAKQMKHATRNVGDAAEAAAEHVKDEAVEGAEKTKEGLKELASKAIGTEMGRGIFAISLGALSIAIGIKKLKSANEMAKDIAQNMKTAS